MNDSINIKAKRYALTGAVFLLLAVVLGAMGTHALTGELSAERLESFDTGVKYQVYHGLAMLAIGLIGLQCKPGSPVGRLLSRQAIYFLFLFGVLFFSGSIYLLSTQGLSGINWGFLWPVTPFGGLLLIAGWAVFAYRIFILK